jgi:hypothetical protein
MLAQVVVDEVPEHAERLHHDERRDDEQRDDADSIGSTNPHGRESITRITWPGQRIRRLRSHAAA